MNQKTARFDFIGKRKIWFILSLIVVLVGVAGYFIQGGFNFGIDFLGGSLIEVEFDGTTDVGQIRDVLEDAGYGSSIIQQTDNNKYIIRIKAEEIGKTIEIDEKARILDALDEGMGINPVLLQDRTVNPGFGSILIRNALMAMAISLAGILIYVWIRFEFRFGATAIVTLGHDVLVTLGVYAILNREINTSTIAALLTIIGYSLNDTIVVFDRIRENTPNARSLGYTNIVNQSVNMTLTRSVNTSLTSLFPGIIATLACSASLVMTTPLGVTSSSTARDFLLMPWPMGW